jgi:hypothetical protein
MKSSSIVWIKMCSLQDGAILWDGEDGDQQTVKDKLKALTALGYDPVIDHDMNDPEPQFYTLLMAEDGQYKKPHISFEKAMEHVEFQCGKNPGRGMFGWFDSFGRTMNIIDIHNAVPETLELLDRAMADTSGEFCHEN